MSQMQDDITVDEIKDKLADRWWRLNHLYYIIDKDGNKVLFKPNEVQEYVHDNLHNANIIPKARQLGLTTFSAIFFLDQILFSENRTAGIICHRIEDQKKIFQNKIRFAWDNLHPWLKEKIGEPVADSAFELRFPNGGTIFTSMSTRSGTVQYLHVSEFGYICKHFPEKANEIMTGALNSIGANQIVIIESTAKGKEGHFHNLVMSADQNAKMRVDLTPLDFKLFFFPWYLDPTYSLEGEVLIDDEMQKYFSALKTRHSIELTKGQMSWYVKKKKTQGENMFQEFPSTLEECFMVSLEGAYYAKQMERVFAEQRIMRVPWDPMYSVESWWDLGMDDMNVMLLTQSVGPQIRFIDMYVSRNEPLDHYTKWLDTRAKEIGYRYSAHHLPHDVAVKELGTGLSRQEVLWKLGLRNVLVGKKIGINEGIDKVRALFSKFQFDEEKTKKLADALFNYRKDFDAKLGVWKDKPRHDESSHYADAVRLLGCEWREIYPEIAGQETGVLGTNQSFF